MKRWDVEDEVEDTDGVDGVDDVGEPAEMIPLAEEVGIGKIDEGRIGHRKAGIARRREGKDAGVVDVEVCVALALANRPDLRGLGCGRTEIDDDDLRRGGIIISHQRDAVDHPRVRIVPPHAKHHGNVRGTDGFAPIKMHVLLILVRDGRSRRENWQFHALHSVLI